MSLWNAQRARLRNRNVAINVERWKEVLGITHSASGVILTLRSRLILDAGRAAALKAISVLQAV